MRTTVAVIGADYVSQAEGDEKLVKTLVSLTILNGEKIINEDEPPMEEACYCDAIATFYN